MISNEQLLGLRFYNHRIGGEKTNKKNFYVHVISNEEIIQLRKNLSKKKLTKTKYIKTKTKYIKKKKKKTEQNKTKACHTFIRAFLQTSRRTLSF